VASLGEQEDTPAPRLHTITVHQLTPKFNRHVVL
jgi:hypothetical protein